MKREHVMALHQIFSTTIAATVTVHKAVDPNKWSLVLSPQKNGALKDVPHKEDLLKILNNYALTAKVPLVTVPRIKANGAPAIRVTYPQLVHAVEQVEPTLTGKTQITYK